MNLLKKERRGGKSPPFQGGDSEEVELENISSQLSIFEDSNHAFSH